MSAQDVSLEQLQLALREFARARDWEQFQSPKNLSMALAVEAAELLEEFQWLGEAESDSLEPAKKQAVAFEMADVLMYLVRMADRLDIDLLATAVAKMALNEQRYPADKVRGIARKYTDYQD
jgi:NTP pyrophosphatase (non-canonical NTP hydrolase)